MIIKHCPNCGSTMINKSELNSEERFCAICKTTFPESVFSISKDEKDLAKKAIIEEQRLIINTYLNLSKTIQNAGGSMTIIYDYQNKPLKDFLVDICAKNGIRFVFNQNKKEN